MHWPFGSIGAWHPARRKSPIYNQPSVDVHIYMRHHRAWRRQCGRFYTPSSVHKKKFYRWDPRKPRSSRGHARTHAYTHAHTHAHTHAPTYNTGNYRIIVTSHDIRLTSSLVGGCLSYSRTFNPSYLETIASHKLMISLLTENTVV